MYTTYIKFDALKKPYFCGSMKWVFYNQMINIKFNINIIYYG
ncbi:hypothetical protein BN1221_00387c [Brenneria goodwinii]|uniref:Uncharacterized protein n=1 Tax=Brenneria goodwinii TaxID=1109412 RepID=A0A0G4JQ19_9GAMM|nr:hypothetical protein BN1221_00387c [Brenneria goodwinii]